MAVYNNSKIDVIKPAIDSILRQTYTDFEFIICDDGSTDNTFDVIYDITKSDKRVRLIRSNVNIKAGGARNNCLKEAKGSYIAIMDSDDISHFQRLEKQVSYLERFREYDFVGTRAQFFSDNIDNITGEYWYCKEPKSKDFLMTLPFVHGSLMFRAEVLHKVSGYSESRKNERAEDYELLMRLYANGFKGYNINDILYFIRLDDETYKRRKYKYRFKECAVKYKGFTEMGLMPMALPYVVKPLFVGLIPRNLLNILKKEYYKGSK